MSWYEVSLLAMLVSSFTPIFQKWALNYKINRTKLLFYVFIGMFLLYLGYNLVVAPAELKEVVQTETFWLWGLLIGVLSMAGNIAMTKAFGESPNPGYVQSVIVANVLLVLILSSIFLGAPIGIGKTVGTFMIIAGLVGLFLFNKTTKKAGRWPLPATIATICFGLMFLVVKKMTNIGISPGQILVVLFLIASIGFVVLAYQQKVGFRLGNLSQIVILPIILYILVGFLSNLLNFVAIKLVANPGYSTAIFNVSVIPTLFISWLVFPREFGGEFSIRKWLGVFIIIGGVILVILG